MITCHTVERARHAHSTAHDNGHNDVHGNIHNHTPDPVHGDTRHDSSSLGTDNIVDTVTLDETDRHRRRITLTSDSGIAFLLELSVATRLLHDDILRLSDGRGIRVQALPEPLYEIRAADPLHLLTLAWHVGNRHLATQIKSDHLRIRRDTVIRTMLEQLGAEVSEIQAGFDPQGGAYGDAHASHHHHSHD